MSLQVTISDSQNGQSRYLDAAEHEPVSILSGGVRRAVVVSPEFFDRAIEVLEDLEDIRTAAAARLDGDEVPLDELKAEFGL
ncbi:type II toxin-antitoxin system Phd/YefM family antitoxin [Corynebacterium stationis]|uniref:Antitoxin n=1 Tax=Corynebacterium stationis TaxID=1705 RepID=A0AB36CK18_9CORY|nr:type II toxin-antitoxin system Phd/YefM family antitoxin [Corynebacterium stationis]NME89105.1 type II toxin-antitoxin system Phd/YefM family antitoxin [Corynebacterium stationis]